jgi:hypothetical protein
MTYLLKFKTENAETKALLEYLQKSNIVEFVKPTVEDYTLVGEPISIEGFQEMIMEAEAQYKAGKTYSSQEVKEKLKR